MKNIRIKLKKLIFFLIFPLLANSYQLFGRNVQDNYIDSLISTFHSDYDEEFLSKNIDFVGWWKLGHTWTVAADDNIVFYGKYHAIEIADYSDPYNPILLASLRTFDRIEHMEYEDGKLYVANWRSGVRIFDVSDPTNPYLLGYYLADAVLRDVAVQDDYIYLASGYNGLEIIDAQDPANPFLVGSYDVEGESAWITCEGNRAYLTEYGTLHIFDVTDKSDPLKIGEYISHPYFVRDLESVNDTLYTVQDYGGFVILDATDPENVHTIGGYDKEDFMWRIKYQNNKVYIAAFYSGLTIIDCLDVQNPQEIFTYLPCFYANDIYLEPERIYIADHAYGLF